MKQINKIKNFSMGVVLALALSACSSVPGNSFKTGKSYLQESHAQKTERGSSFENVAINAAKSASVSVEQQNSQSQGVSYLSLLSLAENNKRQSVDLTQQFSDNKLIQLTADDLPLKDFLHYVMGDLLGVSYILGEQIKSDKKTVTLNLQKDISQRKIFNLSEQLLSERGYVIRFDDDIYYIHKEEGKGSQGAIVYGYGNNIENVPNTSATIVQLVPFTFGMQSSLANTLKQLIKIKASADFQLNTLILQGKRKEIIRALEFVNLMDQPGFKNRYIGVYKANYVSTDILIEKLPMLLKQEGITVSGKGQNDQAISLVALDRIATIVLFANNKKLIARAGFWAKQIDEAPSGNQLQYFLYQPEFARATDLGASLQMLIGGVNSGVGQNTSATSQNKQSSNSSQKKGKRTNNTTASNSDMTLVVDELANALIFYSTGDKYRQLLPLIRRLDVMPKQVILEVMIAEVKLTDEFKQGVEFALTNQGDASLVGGFELLSGSGGMSYALSGAQGNISYNLLQTNTNVNVLSRPSILVRDGVTASITVGDDIPTVGTIITDAVNGSQTSIVYRKTGVELQVTPTINARGVIIMKIDQKISNQAPGDDSVAGSPIIFERSINTEVVAESGQTIILGGLISETKTINDRSVPYLSNIPLIGRLFDSTSDTTDKTELVVLVTPRIIESTEEWDHIKAKLSLSLNNLILDQ